MRLDLRLRILLLLVPATMWADSGVGLHISFQSLQELDALSSSRIASADDATAYVRKAAALCGIADPSLIPDDVESRLAAAEWKAEEDPSKLVSDDQVAEAFNLMSDEFRVTQPTQLTASDILQYRSVMASIFPHVFNGKNVGGSRPVGAVVILYQLWFNGGITQDVRNAEKLDRPPGSLRVTGGHVVGGNWTRNENPSLTGRKYQVAGYSYFAQRSPQEIRSFIGRVTAILVEPIGRSL